MVKRYYQVYLVVYLSPIFFDFDMKNSKRKPNEICGRAYRPWGALLEHSVCEIASCYAYADVIIFFTEIAQK